MRLKITPGRLLLAPIVTVFCLIALGLVLQPTTGKVYADYRGDRLIDDGIFLNARSMNSGEIQNFLVARGSGLASRSFLLNCYGPSSQERQWYSSVGAPCDQTVPAAQIIYYVAQVYGVNPQAIIATLQKEQSLITTPNPSDWQINQAMGYACPTTGQCSGNSTFFYQLDNATWALRWHFERARGNNSWWTTSSSWTCGTEKNFYKPNLYPGQNVSFYDEDGVQYRTFLLANAATSALYCYTPHTYNNPQGLYGLPQYGNVGRYYSGSYNFVLWYERWFGSSTIPNYSAQFLVMGSYPSVYPGQSATTWIKYKNTGNTPWYDRYSAPNGIPPIVMATSNPINRGSGFADSSWLSISRPTKSIAAVYDYDTVTLAADQTKILPGQVVQFNITFTAPAGKTPGQYREYLQPVMDGSPYWMIGAYGYVDVNVVNPVAVQFTKMSSYPQVNVNSSSVVSISYKNTGAVPLYDAASAPSGVSPIVISTAQKGRASQFGGQYFGQDYVLSNRFAAVYEADGVTRSSNQTVAQPGQIMQFDVSFSANATAKPSTYREWIQPIQLGAATPSIGGTGYVDVTVAPTIHQVSYNSLGGYPTIKVGLSGTTWVRYLNSGTGPLYSRSVINSLISPLALANTNPINRTSSFVSSNWLSASRPTTAISKIYQSDGVTLSLDQQVAQPGQIIEFDLTYTIPAGTAIGVKREYIQPILEGAPFWAVGPVGYLDINVTN